MAKWGEGDPRWIVEERPDSHNVNNWHWRERDASDWSKNKIRSLLKGLEVKDPAVGSATIEEITSCEGEASINNRKNKIICFYEFVVKGKWKGTLVDKDVTYKGLFEIPNLSEENDANEVDVDISFDKDQRRCDELKELMRKKGTTAIRAQLQIFTDSLKSECAASIQCPTSVTKSLPKPSSKSELDKNQKNLNKEMKNIKIPAKSAPENGVGAKIDTKKLKMSETFMTDTTEMFSTLTKKERVSAWARCSVSEDARNGNSFSLFDGNVIGQYTSVVPDAKIVMKWRLKSWPDAHYSTVTLTIKQSPNGATVDLEQSGVPADCVEATQIGWKRYYWSSIKQTFGYGSNIM